MGPCDVHLSGDDRADTGLVQQLRGYRFDQFGDGCFQVDCFGGETLYSPGCGTHGPFGGVSSVEGTGSYGAGVTSNLSARGEWVAEFNKSNPTSGDGAKTDTLDAPRAARQVLGRSGLSTPRIERWAGEPGPPPGRRCPQSPGQSPNHQRGMRVWLRFQVASPVFHDRSSCFEEIASGVGAFYASHGVC